MNPLLILLLTAPAWCPNDVMESGALRVSSHWQGSVARCALSVGARDPVAPTRSFVFGSDGRLMVFESYDDEGALSESTGARVLWMFPRRQDLSAHLGRDGRLRVRHPGGAELLFSAETGRLMAAFGAEVGLDPEIRPDNGAGLRVDRFDGLVLDAGFRIGGDPAAAARGSSVFVDAAGHRCRVRNSQVFVYEDGEPRLRHETDDALLDFLNRRARVDHACRALDLSPLARAVVAGP